jgi:hypothetical protein
MRETTVRAELESAPAGTASIDEKEEVVGQGETRFRWGKFIRPKLD